MEYQLFEKAIFSDDDVLYFRDIADENLGYGEPDNTFFPDATNVDLGTAIITTSDLAAIKLKKRKLEIKRMKVMSEGSFLLFLTGSQELHNRFFESDNFKKLVDLYKMEFKLNLLRTDRYFSIEIDGAGFWIPPTANDDLVVQIQALLGIYFYSIRYLGNSDF